MRVFLTFVIILLANFTFSQVDIPQTEKDSIPLDSFDIIFQEISAIIDMDSTDAGAYLERADLICGVNNKVYAKSIYGNQEIYQQALKDYDKAVELNPYSYLPYLKRAILKDRFLNYQDALEDYDEALTYAYVFDNKMKIRINRARLKSKVGAYEVAIKDLEKALLEDHQNASILNTLALIHMDIEDFPKALKYLNRSLEFHPEDAVTFSNIGFVALNAGKYQKAINIYNDQIEKDSTRSIFFNNRGFAKFHLGQKEEALKDISLAIELNAHNSFAYKNRAIVYLDLGKNENACEDLQKAKELGFTTEFGEEVIKILFDKCLEVNQKPK